MFEVGKTYTDDDGAKRKCIAIDGDYAYLAHNSGTGYRWHIADGTSVDLGSGYNITPPYPRPVIKWYPGETAPKTGKRFLVKYGRVEILTWRDGGFYRVAGGSQYGKVHEWSPLPE
jgi:hypothetical protein